MDKRILLGCLSAAGMLLLFGIATKFLGLDARQAIQTGIGAIPLIDVFAALVAMGVGGAVARHAQFRWVALLLMVAMWSLTLFTIVSTLAAIMVVFSWGMILVAYLVYRRQRPDLHAGSIFKMPAGVVMSWVSLLFFAFAIFIMIFDPDTLLALLASPLWFIALWGFWKLKQRREGQLTLDNQSA